MISLLGLLLGCADVTVVHLEIDNKWKCLTLFELKVMIMKWYWVLQRFWIFTANYSQQTN